MKEIFIVTGNDHKWNEMNLKLNKKIDQKINDICFKRVSLDLDEIQGTEDEIIKHKAISAFKKINKPCIVEDVSFGFKDWNWFPGPYIKHLLKKVDSSEIYKLLKDNSAKVVCVIAFITSLDDIKIVKGTVKGKIVKQRKNNGFDFDTIFVPEGYDLAYSEMNKELKNKISHRGKALDKLVKILKDY